MGDGYEKALTSLWRDRCTIVVKEAVRDEKTGLTKFRETILAKDVPCKLSFKILYTTDGLIYALGEGPTVSVPQRVKLFLSPDISVPPGSKITVKRGGKDERCVTYDHSGEPGVFTHHQEIMLIPEQDRA